MNKNADSENILYLELKNGRVAIECFPDVAPKHISYFKKLSREGFFDGLPFYRVIEGFMAQTGNPRTRDGGKVDDIGVPNSTNAALPAEFSDIPHERGIVSTARFPDDINSGDCEFFIMLDSCPRLNGEYTVWGRVIEGMEHIDALKTGTGECSWVEKDGTEDALNGLVDNPDCILSMKVAADIITIENKPSDLRPQ